MLTSSCDRQAISRVVSTAMGAFQAAEEKIRPPTP